MKNESITTKRSKLLIKENEPFLAKVFNFNKDEKQSIELHSTREFIKLIQDCTKLLLESKDAYNKLLLFKLTKGMEEMRQSRLSLEELLSSGIGLTVQKLHEFTSKDPLLKDLANTSKQLKRTIKAFAYHELFGRDITTKIMAIEGSDENPVRISVKKTIIKRKGRKPTNKRKAKEEYKTERLPSVIIVGEAMEKRETQDKETTKEDVPSRDIDLTKSIREKLYKELRKVEY
jgi:hypothetical protein